MSKSLSCLLFFFLSLALLSIKLRGMTSRATAAMIRCHNAERQALLELKRRLDDSSNRLSSWVGEDCCAWKGIGCSNVTGHVIKLNLPNDDDGHYSSYLEWQELALRGDISTASSLQSLKELAHLDLSGNDFTGPIPAFLGSFAGLTYLDLSSNAFTGLIPAFLGSFARLTYLDLSEASFTGKVPDQLGNLSNLRYLDLSYNWYNGNDYYGDSDGCLYIENPRWIARLTSLRHLNMSDVSFRSASNWFEALNALPHIEDVELAGCDLIGPPPHSAPHLNFTSLQTLNLAGNNINGTEPMWLYNITTLETLDFSRNDIYWSSMHGSITRLASLKELDLSRNIISKSFLLLLANLCKLQILGLAEITIKDKPSNLEMLFSGCLMYSLEELYLYNNQLNGSLPWLGNLKNIKHIDLYNSSLHGSILNSLGSLTSLQYLNLGYNNLDGIVGESIGQLKNLIHLDLSYNLLHGSFPVSLGILTSLQSLDLQSNNLNGIIGESIGQLKNLIYLDLYNNSLHGSLPMSLGSLTSLQYLNLGRNNLNGTVEVSIGQLKNLSYLDLSYNSLSLPTIHLANLSSLKHLDISHNILFMEESDDWIPTFQLVELDMDLCKIVHRPHFPKWLQTQTKLYSLYLRNVGIEGTIPNWLPSSLRYLSLSNNKIDRISMHFFPNLNDLELSNNSFSGHLPLQITNMMPSLEFLDLSNNHFIGELSLNFTKLQYLDLSNNMFSGHLNPTINNTLLNLQYLDLSMNSFSGSIPHSLCQMNLLVILHISNNSFSGQLPNCWNSSFNANYLDFSNNQIYGEIPNTLCNLKRIKFLHLAYNHLSGRIPLCLHDCKYLTTLDAGHNYLVGNIPSWSNKSLPYLKVLNLRSNFLSGIIPELSKLTCLQTLDLSNNHLSGSIPQTFGNFITMRTSQHHCNITNSSFNFDTLWLFIKGKEYEYITLDSLAKSIDLSNNHLSGYIPKEIGNLHGLQNLYLSRNNLIGEIPRSIGGMQNLEALDLSRNNLSGAIPSSLRDLTFLAILNLSYNNFSGSIPTGGQLQTFDASTYIGNRYLCGFPLIKSCTNDKTKGNAEEGNKDRDGRREIIWLWSSITLGFIMGIWGIWGTLLLHKRWRIFYFHTIDNTYDKLCMETLVKMRRKSFIED